VRDEVNAREPMVFLVGLALRLFYRRIVYVGLGRVSPSAPVLFVLNHPNALVDPLFVLAAVRRPVHFLAKAPLLRVPLFGRLLRACGVLPVFRHQDGADTRQNEETFRECHRVLARGECVAIFPEGTTHSDDVLRPAKTGAARIALGAEEVAGFGLGLEVMPVGLQYEAKQTFRSDVTVWFGEPHTVAGLAAEYTVAAAAAVQEETCRLAATLHDVTLNISRQEMEELVAATTIFAGPEAADETAAIALRRQFLDAYAWLSAAVPDRVSRLRRALRRHVAILRRLGLTDRDLRAGREPSTAGFLLRAFAALPMLVLAICGVVFEWVPYIAVDRVARRSERKEPEVTATVKLVAALVLYPLWWLATAGAVAYALGWLPAVALLLAHPIVAYLALTALERLGRFRTQLQLFRLAARPRRLEKLRRHERAIGQEMQALAALYQEQALAHVEP
jgi:glycerol-3-phosphate O-acyltransferase / dihydroxyacetone phosphate acyltransferase